MTNRTIPLRIKIGLLEFGVYLGWVFLFFDELKILFQPTNRKLHSSKRKSFLPLKYQTNRGQSQKSKGPTNLVLKDHFANTWAPLLASLGTHLKEKLGVALAKTTIFANIFLTFQWKLRPLFWIAWMHPCGFRSIMPYSQGRDGASDTAHCKASASFGMERKTGVYPFRTSKYQSFSLVSSHLCNHRVNCSYRCIHINFNCPWRWQRPRNMPSRMVEEVWRNS